MTMTRADVLTLLQKLGTSGVAGATEAIRRRNLSRTQGTTTLTPSQLALLDAASGSTRGAGPSVRYRHPESIATIGVDPKTGNNLVRNEPLTAAQVTWLGRLPKDPAEISHSDAALVFRLLKTVPRNSDDAPLLRSIADPLGEHHDRLQATADLEHARLDPIPVPQSALKALADAIAAEFPELTYSEALGRASEELRAFAQDRLNDKADAQARAQKRIDQLNEQERHRVNPVAVERDGRRHLTDDSHATIAYAHYRAEHGDNEVQTALATAYARGAE